jgi:hypothetical protein
MAKAQGRNQVEAPPELVEIGLMEKFHWTPMQIDEIPLGKLQRIFVAMEQRDLSQTTAKEEVDRRNGKPSKNSTPVRVQKGRRK